MHDLNCYAGVIESVPDETALALFYEAAARPMDRWLSGGSVSVCSYAVAGALLLAWATIDLLRIRKNIVTDEVLAATGRRTTTTRWRSILVATTVSCSALVSSTYLGFCIFTTVDIQRAHSSARPQPVSPEPAIFAAAAWAQFSLVAFYSGNRGVRRGSSGWPLSIRFWWAAFGLYDTFSAGVYVVRNYHTRPTLPGWIPSSVGVLIPDVAVFPLVMFIGVSAVLLDRCGKSAGDGDLNEPLLDSGRNADSNAGFSGAGVWSKLLFTWLNPVFEIGRRLKLDLKHIPGVPKSETAESSHFTLQESLLRWPKARTSSSLVRAIAHSEWKHLSTNAVFAGINTLASYTGPLLITSFVQFLSSKDPTTTGNTSGYILAALFFVSKTIESLSQRQWYFGARRIGMRVRSALMVAIYNKSLSIKYSTAGTGRVINLLDVDVERIGDFSWYFHSIWLLPVQVSLALLILYWNLGGLPAVAALLATVLVMISNVPLANLQEKLHSRIMVAKDARMKATTECLKCIRILKLQSWENVYLERLLQLRSVERGWLRKYLYICSAVAFLFWASPTLVSVITFGVCILSNTPLTPGAVLSALATFRILQDPIYNLPELVSMMAQTKVSIDRVQDFIKDDDQRKSSSPSDNNGKPQTPGAAIEIEPAEYAWESSSRSATIQINKKIKIMKGEKVAVCGLVGSGKSSFLYSVIGEIPKTSGIATRVFGATAYVPQTAWIQTGTVRDNILFGKEMDKGFYDEVVQGCALSRDFDMWVDGDMTVVGERGINLSGGQKQRIQLARAVYSNSDVYLLDDPFSAVDAHTGGHLYKECLQRLLSNKTVIYATHQLEFLDSSDLILVIRDGKIVQHGKYQDLVADVNGEFVRQLSAHKESVNQVSPTKTQLPIASQVKEAELTEEKNITRSKTSDYTEETESGRVKWEVYTKFVTTAFGGALVPVILLCQVLFQGLQIGSNYWIAWGTEEGRIMSRERLIGVFVCLSIGSSVFVLGRAVLLATVAVETSQKLFVKMATCIFRAPISFFDQTPSSRILNRSSTDQSILDTDIPYRVGGLVFALVQLLGIVILMSLIAWPVLILFVIILALSFWYQAYYISTARELARMVSIRKSPILHHLSESVVGSATIRCFKQERRFTSKNIMLIDDYSRVSFHNSATMEWLSVRTNFLFNLIFFAVLIILVIVPKSTINPSLAGLATTYGLNLNVLQAWIIWNLCNVENKMISVERIMQFTDLPSEPPLVIEHCRPGPSWPTVGTIRFENLHVCYQPGLPMVLRGINCVFPGQKKIGVVGRTGSGKSTLIQALFRVVEPSIGGILIDGIDICQIGLHDLRSRLSIIPQDPSLFHGTVRTNLDPLQQHSDFEIWEALRKCHLDEIITQDHRLLDAPVAEDGENWSVGQRQLVCLARALLKKKRILILDEATASVDTATDNMIQRTIREATNSCTVISVAHRIPTVIDNDLVLVLDEGKILEYDSPKELLKDEMSAFSRLVADFLRHSEKVDGT